MTAARNRLGRDSVAALVLATVAVAVAACGSTSGSPTTPGPGATSSLVAPADASPRASAGDASAAAPSGSSAVPQSPVSGLILHVDTAGLGRVTGFRLLTSTGQQLDFTMGLQDNAAQFPAAHLSEHMASGTPVLVTFRREGSTLVAYHLGDAPALPSGSAAPSAS